MTVEPIYRLVADYLQINHPTDYLAVFCKNTPKCEDLVRAVQAPKAAVPPAAMEDLFKYL